MPEIPAAAKADANVHVALLPSSGMGHLSPFLRLASLLSAHGCTVSLITIYPMVSSSESRHVSRFFSACPHIHSIQFHLLPFDPTAAACNDPFFLHFEAIRRSSHLLPSLLDSSTSPPVTALVTDVSLFSSVANVHLPCPNYILFTSCVAMLAFNAYLPNLYTAETDFKIPGVPFTISKSSIPPSLHNPDHIFTKQFTENSHALGKASGILVNTMYTMEPETLDAINDGKVVPGLPAVDAIGPLEPCEFERVGQKISWLDEQPEGSVIYVSFGSRTALSVDQIKQLGDGLEKSGYRFLWVVKSRVVDRDDEEVELGELVGSDFLERVKDKGVVVKDWVDQWEVLGHPAVGGFLSHCGWNSAMEAAWQGVPMLAWPQGADQKVNAEVVVRSGMGIWVKEWGWEGEAVVTGDEISRKVRELMINGNLKAHAARMRKEASRAFADNGSSHQAISRFIEEAWIEKA